MEQSEMPEEVRAHVVQQFLTDFRCGMLVQLRRLDESRVIWGPTREPKAAVWRRALRSGKANFDQVARENGWRKCHTQNYWVYYAKVQASAIDRLGDLVRE